jgi:nitrate/nitrite transporter NarK
MLVIGIHRAVDVAFAIFVGLFILYGAGGVFRFDPVICGFEIRAVAGFVSE